jgi:uncharacterized protein (DUF302 family)
VITKVDAFISENGESADVRQATYEDSVDRFDGLTGDMFGKAICGALIYVRASISIFFRVINQIGGTTMKRFLIAACLGMFGTMAIAEGSTVYPFDGSFDDATFSVESAIIGKGLVIDYVSHAGEMLNRTGADLGSDVELFAAADIFVFCSASLSREVMEVDPMNIAYCPYGVFVADRNGEVMIGYRNYPQGEMQEVQSLLDEIAREAIGE